MESSTQGASPASALGRMRSALLRDGFRRPGGASKVAFVPSPQTQERVQQQAQQGAEVQQDPNSNAVSPGGITIDDIAGMLEQMHQEFMHALTTVQNQVSEVRAAIPPADQGGGGNGGGGGGGGETRQQIDNALERIAQLEQLVNGIQDPAQQQPPQ